MSYATRPTVGELSETMINLQSLIDDAKCYETVRQLRWPEDVRCPRCNADQVTKQGRDTTQPARQKYHSRPAAREDGAIASGR